MYEVELRESTSACVESPYRRGETSRDLTCSLKACHANCMHR